MEQWFWHIQIYGIGGTIDVLDPRREVHNSEDFETKEEAIRDLRKYVEAHYGQKTANQDEVGGNLRESGN